MKARFWVSGRDSFVISGHLGYPEMVIDSTGTVTWTADHLPFGEVFSETNPENDPGLRYPGQWTVPEAEGLGLPEMYYNLYRWYRAGWGRYSQADPLGADGFLGSDYRLASHQAGLGGKTHSAQSDQKGNAFSYGFSNPLFFSDPNGLASCSMVPAVPSECFEPGSGCCASYCSDQVRIAVCRLEQTAQGSALLDALGVGGIGFGIGFAFGGVTTFGPGAVPAGCIGAGVGVVAGYCLSDGGLGTGLEGIGDQWRRCMNTCTCGATTGWGADLAGSFVE